MNDELLPDLLLAIEQQLLSPKTPYVRKTLDRLLKLGIEESEAKTQLAICLGEEMDNVLKTKKPFDETAYQLDLLSLPFPAETEDEGAEEE